MLTRPLSAHRTGTAQQNDAHHPKSHINHFNQTSHPQRPSSAYMKRTPAKLLTETVIGTLNQLSTLHQQQTTSGTFVTTAGIVPSKNCINQARPRSAQQLHNSRPAVVGGWARTGTSHNLSRGRGNDLQHLEHLLRNTIGDAYSNVNNTNDINNNAINNNDTANRNQMKNDDNRNNYNEHQLHHQQQQQQAILNDRRSPPTSCSPPVTNVVLRQSCSQAVAPQHITNRVYVTPEAKRQLLQLQQASSSNLGSKMIERVATISTQASEDHKDDDKEIKHTDKEKTMKESLVMTMRNSAVWPVGKTSHTPLPVNSSNPAEDNSATVTTTNQKNTTTTNNTFDNTSTTTADGSKENKENKDAAKDRWVLGKKIGEGAYAVVRIAEKRHCADLAAVKVYEKSKLAEPQRLRSVKREIKLLSKLQHPNIVQLLDAIEASNHIYVVMELLEGGSAHALLKRQPQRRIPESCARFVFRQILRALEHCHRLKVTHRDIKLENILLSKTGEVKLCDFGFATFVPDDKPLKVFCGTPSYMSPEIVARKEYCGFKADMYALGVLLFALLSGSLPFRDENNKALFKKIYNGQYEFPPHVSDKGKALVAKLLAHKPENRPTATEVFSDPWMLDQISTVQHLVDTSHIVILNHFQQNSQNQQHPPQTATAVTSTFVNHVDKGNTTNTAVAVAVASQRPSTATALPSKVDLARPSLSTVQHQQTAMQNSPHDNPHMKVYNHHLQIMLQQQQQQRQLVEAFVQQQQQLPLQQQQTHSNPVESQIQKNMLYTHLLQSNNTTMNNNTNNFMNTHTNTVPNDASAMKASHVPSTRPRSASHVLSMSRGQHNSNSATSLLNQHFNHRQQLNHSFNIHNNITNTLTGNPMSNQCTVRPSSSYPKPWRVNSQPGCSRAQHQQQLLQQQQQHQEFNSNHMNVMNALPTHTPLLQHPQLQNHRAEDFFNGNMKTVFSSSSSNSKRPLSATKSVLGAGKGVWLKNHHKHHHHNHHDQQSMNMSKVSGNTSTAGIDKANLSGHAATMTTDLVGNEHEQQNQQQQAALVKREKRHHHHRRKKKVPTENTNDTKTVLVSQ